jgi:hypothetical protein
MLQSCRRNVDTECTQMFHSRGRLPSRELWPKACRCFLTGWQHVTTGSHPAGSDPTPVPCVLPFCYQGGRTGAGQEAKVQCGAQHARSGSWPQAAECAAVATSALCCAVLRCDALCWAALVGCAALRCDVLRACHLLPGKKPPRHRWQHPAMGRWRQQATPLPLSLLLACRCVCTQDARPVKPLSIALDR